MSDADNLVEKHRLPDPPQRYIVPGLERGLKILRKFNRVRTEISAPIIAKELAPGLRVVLVESDKRKCVFLRTVIRELGLSVKVINDRIENVKFDEVVYLSARALRNLNSLLFIVENNVSRETVCVFPKGRSYKKELVESNKNWKFNLNLIDSNTSEDSKVIVLRGLERVN